MSTITLPKAEFDILKKRAFLYEAILRFLPERKWGIENYTSKRIREFMRQDRIDRKTYPRVKKLLSL